MRLRSNNKKILDNVTGIFPPGSMVAVMGPSGGGKTTFMSALCGRANYGNITGEILINDKVGTISNFKTLIGYVPQDDIMHDDLSV